MLGKKAILSNFLHCFGWECLVNCLLLFIPDFFVFIEFTYAASLWEIEPKMIFWWDQLQYPYVTAALSSNFLFTTVIFNFFTAEQ